MTTRTMHADDINRVIAEISQATPRQFTKRQEAMTRTALAIAKAETVRRALDRQARSKWWSLDDFLTEIEGDRAPLGPDHNPNCPHCDGGGWLPTPAQQFDQAQQGHRNPKITKCTGRPNSLAIVANPPAR